MENRQYYATCRYCKMQILMVLNTKNGRYVPCDSEIRRYIPNPNGTEIYVSEDGQTKFGFYDESPAAEFGYRKHHSSCKVRNRK